MEIAAAMLTSMAMFEQRYVREMREYRQRRKQRYVDLSISKPAG
jgi:hypothetical protein